jgi:hypothetical protein
MTEPSGAVDGIFFGTWVALAIGIVVFHLRADVTTKRRWHRWIAFGPAILLVFFVGLMMGPVFAIVAVPPMLLIGYLNWKFTKYCPACGAMCVKNPPWGAFIFCASCGARLDEPRS